MQLNSLKNRIIEKAQELGASLAGIINMETLKESPSHVLYGRLDAYRGVGSRRSDDNEESVITWPEHAKSAVIIAIEHPENKPELDWWLGGFKGGTPGNHTLMKINAKLIQWMKQNLAIEAADLSYYVEKGGIFLKDAAVLAGLGCIGKNNMLVTREFGPRVRLRSLFISELLPATHPIDFDPCKECHIPCRQACPQSAFSNTIYSESEFKLAHLPARTGVYSRSRCNRQMEWDKDDCEKTLSEDDGEYKNLVKYCRRCETTCPVGAAEQKDVK